MSSAAIRSDPEACTQRPLVVVCGSALVPTPHCILRRVVWTEFFIVHNLHHLLHTSRGVRDHVRRGPEVSQSTVVDRVEFASTFHNLQLDLSINPLTYDVFKQPSTIGPFRATARHGRVTHTHVFTHTHTHTHTHARTHAITLYAYNFNILNML